MEINNAMDDGALSAREIRCMHCGEYLTHTTIPVTACRCPKCEKETWDAFIVVEENK